MTHAHTRIMALDVGDSRVGVALSDPTFTFALPHSAVNRGSNKEYGEIVAIAKSEQVREIVVGMPYELAGSVGPQGKRVEAFIRQLRGALNKEPNLKAVPITVWDERFSTASAERSLAGSGLKNSSRGAALDKIAASFILESYLMRRGSGGDN